jgi:hypothetical protein
VFGQGRGGLQAALSPAKRSAATTCYIIEHEATPKTRSPTAKQCLDYIQKL